MRLFNPEPSADQFVPFHRDMLLMNVWPTWLMLPPTNNAGAPPSSLQVASAKTSPGLEVFTEDHSVPFHRAMPPVSGTPPALENSPPTYKAGPSP